MRCFCGCSFCFICHEEHDDFDGDLNGHWRRRPGCPRHNNPHPRRGDRLPNWDNGEYEIQDVARGLFDPRQVQLSLDDDVYPAMIPLTYPPSLDQETPRMTFAPLLAKESHHRALARRVTDIHDRLLRGDLLQLWRKDDDSQYRREMFQGGKAFMELISALRHVVTYLHNHFGEIRGLLSRRDTILHRIGYTHYVHILEQRFRLYHQITRNNGELCVDEDPRWQAMFRTVARLQIGRRDEAALTQQTLADAQRLIAGLVAEYAGAPADAGTEDANDRAVLTVITTALHVLIPLVVDGQASGAERLSMPKCPSVHECIQILRDRIGPFASTEDIATEFRARSRNHALAFDLATLVPKLITIVDTKVYQDGEERHWAERYTWLQDVLLTASQERLKSAERGEEEPPRLDELYYVLTQLEPVFRHMATPPTRYMAIPPEAYDAAIAIRDATMYAAGEGPLQAVFAQAYSYLHDLLKLFDRHVAGDLNRRPAKVPSHAEREIFLRQLGQICDALVDTQQRKIQILAVGGQVDAHTNVAANLLMAMRHLLRRLAQPDEYPVDDNQQVLEEVREAWICLSHNWGPFEHEHEWRETEDYLYDSMEELLQAAEDSPEINAEAQAGAALLEARLHAAEAALQGLTDLHEIPQDLAENFERFLAVFVQVLSVGALPAALHGDFYRMTYQDQLWSAYRRWNVLSQAGRQSSNGDFVRWLPMLDATLLRTILSHMVDGERTVVAWEARTARETNITLDGTSTVP
ncbi:hypothetical protein LTR85_009538 [Meristemomyces frigidus]|nr:hypothetical protein LTR85_009538 [Meristemomyces frigidus]